MKTIKILAVILAAIVLLLLLGFLFLYFNGLSGMTQTSTPEAGQIKVACIGDSITYGHGISNWPKNNYPTVLQNLLGESYHVQSFGVSGRAVQDNSDQPYTALDNYTQSKEYDADILVFMMGTNDSKPENWHGAKSFKASLCSLLDNYGDAQLILCTPSTAFFLKGETEGVTSFDIQPAIVEEIAGIVREVAAERNAVLLDIHALTGGNSQWFSKDGVHPDNEGAAAIAKAVYEAITK